MALCFGSAEGNFRLKAFCFAVWGSAPNPASPLEKRGLDTLNKMLYFRVVFYGQLSIEMQWGWQRLRFYYCGNKIICGYSVDVYV